MNSGESSERSKPAQKRAEVEVNLTADNAFEVAQSLHKEVTVLKDEISLLRNVDAFKAKVILIGAIGAVASSLAFIGLWFLSSGMNEATNAIRTDLEVHRIRNEAAHDCLAEKMARLPSPEQRSEQTADVVRTFLHEFLGCVTDTAPTVVPPGAPDIRMPRGEEKREAP